MSWEYYLGRMGLRGERRERFLARLEALARQEGQREPSLALVDRLLDDELQDGRSVRKPGLVDVKKRA